MFDEIKAWFDADTPPALSHDDVLVAAAALLVEAAYIDDRIDPEERAAIDRILKERFDLSAEAARQLAQRGEEADARSVELFSFARTINERFSLAQRIELMEMLWEVVYADGVVDVLEDTLLRRIGGLLYVPDPERGAARQRVVRRRAAAETPSG